MNVFHCFFTIESPNLSAQNVHAPFDANEALFCMFEMAWGSKCILYGAEMDGIEATNEIDLRRCDKNSLQFVQAKALYDEDHRSETGKPWELYQTTYRHWWCDARLSNVTKIFRGIYSHNRIITKIVPLEASSIPEMQDVSKF